MTEHTSEVRSADPQDTADTAQRQRLEQLQRRRSPGRKTRATRTRVVSAGLGMSAMFGIVAALGINRPTVADGTSASTTTQPPRIVVVIHRRPAPAATDATTTAIAGTDPNPTAASVATQPSATVPSPVAITVPPRPTVVAATPTQTQSTTAHTHGSR